MRTRLLRSPILAASCPWRATADDAATPPSPPDVIKLGDITFTGSLGARFYVWDQFQAASGENQHQYSGNLRVNLSERGQTWDWHAEFAAPLMFGLPTGATDAAPQGALALGSNYYGANQNRRNSAIRIR
jgi:hypothetical protein